MFKSITYLLVAMTVCIFSLVHFGVLADVYAVFNDIIDYTEGVSSEPNFQYLSFYFYLFLLFNVFLVMNMFKTEKWLHKFIDVVLVAFTTYLMYEVTTTCEWIVWSQFLSPIIFALSILLIGYLWKLRFPETFNGFIYYLKSLKKENIKTSYTE